MTTVNNFTSYFNKGIGQANYFETFWSGGGVSSEHLSKTCKTISIPGITLTDGVYDGRKFAVGYDFDSFSATFYIDAEGKTAKEFQRWSNAIYNQETGKFGWKDDYTCTTEVKLYTKNLSTYNTIKIQNVFPVNISPIEMSWDTENTLLEISVSFDFDNYKMT